MLGSGAYAANGQAHVDCACGFKTELDRNLLAFNEGRSYAVKHQVHAARRELDILSGWDFKLWRRPHLHDRAIHRHFMNFDPLSTRTRCIEQTIVPASAVADREITGRNIDAGRRRRRPRVMQNHFGGNRCFLRGFLARRGATGDGKENDTQWKKGFHARIYDVSRDRCPQQTSKNRLRPARGSRGSNGVNRYGVCGLPSLAS